MKSTLQRLSEWYVAQCDGDWEHGSGLKISTLDNPGFAVNIDLQDTILESRPYPEMKDLYETNDQWMICRRTDRTFEGRGAPSRLEDILKEFLRWAEAMP